MRRASDGKSEMAALLLDDDATEALLAGRPVDPRFRALEAVVAGVREAADVDAPAPRGELAVLLTSRAALAEAVGTASTAEGVISTRRLRPLPSRAKRVARAAGGLGLAAKLALGAGAAAAAAGGASVAGVLPAPIQEVVHDVTHLGDAPSAPAGPSSDGVGPMTTRGLDPTTLLGPSTSSSSPSTGAPASTTTDDGSGSKRNGPPPHAGVPGSGNDGGNGNGAGNGGGNAGGGGNGTGNGNAGGNGNGGGNGGSDAGNGAGSGNGATTGNGNADGNPDDSGDANGAASDGARANGPTRQAGGE